MDVQEIIDFTCDVNPREKTFAEGAGDSLKKLVGRLTPEDGAMVRGLIIDFGLEIAMDMLNSALDYAEASYEA